MFGLGAPELLIILVVVLVLFGGAKLPQLARSLGQAKNEFEAGTKEGLSAGEVKAMEAKGMSKEEIERERLKAELRDELRKEQGSGKDA
jgi:TatA/E family protein of Tat protein translocase